MCMVRVLHLYNLMQKVMSKVKKNTIKKLENNLAVLPSKSEVSMLMDTCLFTILSVN